MNHPSFYVILGRERRDGDDNLNWGRGSTCMAIFSWWAIRSYHEAVYILGKHARWISGNIHHFYVNELLKKSVCSFLYLFGFLYAFAKPIVRPRVLSLGFEKHRHSISGTLIPSLLAALSEASWLCSNKGEAFSSARTHLCLLPRLSRDRGSMPGGAESRREAFPPLREACETCAGRELQLLSNLKPESEIGVKNTLPHPHCTPVISVIFNLDLPLRYSAFASKGSASEPSVPRALLCSLPRFPFYQEVFFLVTR